MIVSSRVIRSHQDSSGLNLGLLLNLPIPPIYIEASKLLHEGFVWSNPESSRIVQSHSSKYTVESVISSAR